MGLLIKILVYSNKKYAIVTISVNNLVTWLRLRTSEAKKCPKFAERWVYKQEDFLYFTFGFARVLASPILS